ncbi:MAG: NADH-quinone oxidoreductase subunit N [Opitutales bacterium]|nr:NADH-quinone oxidoreductase subunit N [Opitutales bacterium]
MSPDYGVFKTFAEANQWLAIWPELAYGTLALLLLMLEVLFPRYKNTLIPRVALTGQAILLVVLAATIRRVASPDAFGELLQFSVTGNIMRVFFAACGLAVCYIGGVYLKRERLPRVEFFHMVMVISAGMMLLVQSTHFIMLFVALETVTISLYLLVSYCRTSVASLEAGFKYLIQGGLSSAILLFGMVLIYGSAGNPLLPGTAGDPLAYSDIRVFFELNAHNYVAVIGALMVVSGVCFKIAAVPFHVWVGDIYQGAPTPVTAFLAVASKASGFIVLLGLVLGPFLPLAYIFKPLLAALAVITILFGNIAGVGQQNVKRIMGMSGIAHAGYLLIGVVAAFSVEMAVSAILFYLFVYMLASFGVFSVMAHVSREDDSIMLLEDYGDLLKDNPFLGSVLVVGLGSLAGIPPLAGFMGKLILFIAAFQAQLYVLLGVAIVGVVISISYYFGWIKAAVFRNPEVEPVHSTLYIPSRTMRVFMGVLTLLTISVGLYQGILSFVF